MHIGDLITSSPGEANDQYGDEGCVVSAALQG